MEEKYVLELDQWHTPATDYAEAERGDFRIHHGRYTRGYYRMWGVDGHLLFRVRKPIPCISLQQRRNGKWRDWMVDDPPQYRAMQIYAEQSRGRVLTTGLGLGLIVHELAKNPKVESVTVVELSQEVVDLVEPYLPKGIEIVVDDFYHFTEETARQWDTIIVDLWVSSSADEKRELLYHKVLPMGVFLSQKYPGASITFHGFQNVSDIKPVDEEMVKLIAEIGGI